METQIQIKISVEDKELIRRASEIDGVGYSVFCRRLALKKARKILREDQILKKRDTKKK